MNKWHKPTEIPEPGKMIIYQFTGGRGYKIDAVKERPFGNAYKDGKREKIITAGQLIFSSYSRYFKPPCITKWCYVELPKD